VTTPFALRALDHTTPVRSGDIYPEKWDYDPTSQTSNIEMMGSTSPTTRSLIDSTGVFTSDSDEGNDDTGSD
jgi:hypothetical protein